VDYYVLKSTESQEYFNTKSEKFVRDITKATAFPWFNPFRFLAKINVTKKYKPVFFVKLVSLKTK